MTTAKIWRCGRFEFNLDRPLVMGILNVTEDSFSDGGDFVQIEKAIDHAKKMIAEGADIVDIGAQSTRPGAQEIPLKLELQRVIAVLDALKDSRVALSVDTYQPQVMKEALAHGASIINDVYAFRKDGAVEAVAKSNCGLCVMHMKGTPATMQKNPEYHNLMAEVKEFLLERVKVLESAGVQPQRICIDPGFGFGKTFEQNMELFAKAEEFVALGYPVLYGMSRKTFLGVVSGKKIPKERTTSSVVAHTIAVEKGVQIVRVHDVAETVEAIKVLQAIKKEPV